MSDDSFSEVFGDDDATGESRSSTSDDSLDFGEEFGVVKFGSSDEPSISFSDHPTAQLPHWTEPPTGEVPIFEPRVEETISPTPSFGSQRPRVDLTGRTGSGPSQPPPVSRPRKEERIVIGSDPTDPSNRVHSGRDRSEKPQQVRRARPRESRGDSGTAPRPTAGLAQAGGRDMPLAIAVGALLLAVFIGAIIAGPLAVMLLLLAVLVMAALEFFSKTTIAGYQPAMTVGIAGCIAAPLAAYWIGDAALPLVFVFALVAATLTFIGTNSVESGPLPNLSVTMFGILWIGLFGSYGALIIRLSNSGAGFTNVGTDTIVMVVFGIIANDTIAYVVGSWVGRTPLRKWISPTKTMEGVVGGAVGTFVIVILVGMQSETWTRVTDWLIIALVIALLGPIGDLTESMIKRNMDIRDLGTFLRGHGGALDRFDSMLFALPIVYYVTLVLSPWSS